VTGAVARVTCGAEVGVISVGRGRGGAPQECGPARADDQHDRGQQAGDDRTDEECARTVGETEDEQRHRDGDEQHTNNDHGSSSSR
jgi:hypothetical protein